MSIKTGFVLSSVALLSTGCLACSSFATTPSQRVREEYPTALARLESAYQSVRCSGTLVVNDPGKPEPYRGLPVEIAFARSGASKRLIEVRAKEAELGARAYESVLAVSDKYSFKLEKKTRTSQYVLRGLGSPSDRVAHEQVDEFFDNYAGAAFCALGIPISRIMADPTFQLGMVEEILDSGRPLIRINFQFQPNRKANPIRAWLLVDPELGWVLREYKGFLGSRGDIPRSGRVEYQSSAQGQLSLPSSFTFEHPSYRRNFTFKNVTLEPVDSRDFTLSGFGLPEIANQQNRPSWNAALFWYFGGAIALLIGSILLRRLSNSHSKTG